MKTFLFALLTLPLVLVATTGAYAQNAVNTEVPEPKKNVIAVEKALGPNDLSAKTSISQKALKDFAKSYKSVNGETWEKTSEGYRVRFTSDGVMTTIYYGRHGKWFGSLKGYKEDKLSPELRKMIKREYYDYSITYVQEAETIDSEGKPTYIIHLEDNKSIKRLRICDGQMEIWQEYKKQS